MPGPYFISLLSAALSSPKPLSVFSALFHTHCQCQICGKVTVTFQRRASGVDVSIVLTFYYVTSSQNSVTRKLRIKFLKLGVTRSQAKPSDSAANSKALTNSVELGMTIYSGLISMRRIITFSGSLFPLHPAMYHTRHRPA